MASLYFSEAIKTLHIVELDIMSSSTILKVNLYLSPLYVSPTDCSQEFTYLPIMKPELLPLSHTSQPPPSLWLTQRCQPQLYQHNVFRRCLSSERR